MNAILDLPTISTLGEFASDSTRQADDFVLLHFKSESRSPETLRKLMRGPMKVEGMMWVISREGCSDIEINLVGCHVASSSLVILMPGSIVESKVLSDGPIDCYVLFLAPPFIRNINIDLNVLGQLPNRQISPEADPAIRLEPGELDMMTRLIELLTVNRHVNDETVYARSIARSTIASLLYQGMQKVSRLYGEADKDNARDTDARLSRRSNYVRDFMQLVRQNFQTERSVSFYASRLCITPKYLSLIIKAQTGHTAGEVINNFVLLEAKNLLRFSGMNIQQVANALNFPSQSAFGKYFKHLTGQSPSEYQHS